MQNTVLIPISLDDFKTLLNESVTNAIKTQVTPKLQDSFSQLPEYLTRKQAAKVLNISITSLDYIVKDARLTKHRNGRFVRFKKSEVLDFYKTFAKYQKRAI
jgi:excisionase family DNA binding protein